MGGCKGGARFDARRLKMVDEHRSPGKTTLAPGVLLTIASISAAKVEGVDQLASVPGGVDRLLRRGAEEGVQITVQVGIVFVDQNLGLNKDVNESAGGQNRLEHVSVGTV